MLINTTGQPLFVILTLEAGGECTSCLSSDSILYIFLNYRIYMKKKLATNWCKNVRAGTLKEGEMHLYFNT